MLAGYSANAGVRNLLFPSDGATDHHVLDLADGLGRVQTLRTYVNTVHDGVATEQAIRILKVIEALVGCLITRIGDETVSSQQTGRPDELVRVPPERRTGRRAAGTQDALVKTVQFFTVFRRLQALTLRGRIVVDQVRLDRVVLLEELGHIHDQVADDRQPRQRTQNNRLLQAVNISQAGQAILAINIHGVGTADAFAARTTVGNRADVEPQFLVIRYNLGSPRYYQQIDRSEILIGYLLNTVCSTIVIPSLFNSEWHSHSP